MADPFIGQDLGGYRITRLLKRTGMSMIYLARDGKLQRDVIVKIMLPTHSGDESFAARFQQEALATARLGHPNIVHIYDFGQREDLSYMVMEYLPGGSLHDRLTAAAQKGKRLDPAQSAAIVRQIALALDHAHQAGIIHRDVKPSNILFASDGRPVLTDLGIAKAREGPRLTKTMTAVGTPEYMSPEQGRGDPVDGHSDIYSLGVVLYELLCGTLPFQADTSWGLIFKHMYEEPAPIQTVNPAVSPAMRSVIEKALAKRPEDRFQTAREMADAIQRALEAPTRRLYATPLPVTPPGARATPAPKATPSRGTPPRPRPAANDVADAKTRLLSGEAAPAPVSRQPAVQERRGLPVWLWGIGAALLTVAVVWVLSAALRPAGGNPATPAAAAAQVAAASPAPTRPPVEPTATLQPAVTKQAAAAGGSVATRTLPSPTATITAVPPTATATRVPPTATRVPPTATRVPPTATRIPPTATRVPATVTRIPPTSTPIPATRTPVPPTATRPPVVPNPTLAPRATALPAGALPAPILLSPAEDASVTGQATFTWRWSGPALAANQAFELRIWKEGQPDHYGAAEPTRNTSLTINLAAAYGVAQGGPGNYFWTVAVVARDPYQRVGPEAAPRRLQVGGSGGSEGGPAPTWTPPDP